jgi:hypothetical protein
MTGSLVVLGTPIHIGYLSGVGALTDQGHPLALGTPLQSGYLRVRGTPTQVGFPCTQAKKKDAIVSNGYPS